MADPVAITRDGHRTFFKWHRGRRFGTDPVFTGKRILEGMAIGASVEVDLVVTGDKGLAVLHDVTLDRETTGTGPVASAIDAAIRQLRLRSNDGVPIDEPVMLLDDLCTLMAKGTMHPEALLQLDYKEDETVLDARAVENFARATAPVARHMIVSSGSAKAVKMLTDAAPDMRVGYDPCREDTLDRLRETGNFEGFVHGALAASPDAEMVYLAWQIPIVADRAGFDIIGAFHDAGCRIDAWTIPALQVHTEAVYLAACQRLLKLKVDQITTDDPEGLADALSER